MQGIEGTAIISFVIDKDGSLIDFVTYRGVSDAIENECMRILKSSPSWSPGEQNGKPVKVSHKMPIKFKLE